MFPQMSSVSVFCLISCLQAVIALKCYSYGTLECQWTNSLYQAACDDLPNLDNPPSTATEQQCPDTDDRCFMVVSTGENDDVGVRSVSGECSSAADLGWEATDCRNAMAYKEHDVLGWHVTRGRSFGADLTSAEVCVCDTDLCNGHSQQRTVTRLGVCLSIIITVWLNI